MQIETISALVDRHPDSDIFIVGGGPSLEGFDWGWLKGKVTIALNKAADFFTPAYLLTGEHIILKHYSQHPTACENMVFRPALVRDIQKDKVPNFGGKNFYTYRIDEPDKISKEDDILYFRSTVACAGIYLAWKMGAHRIFLLGIDAYRTPKKWYHYDAQPPTPRRHIVNETDDGRQQEPAHLGYINKLAIVAQDFRDRGLYQDMWPGSGIFNLSERSMVPWFEPARLAEVKAEYAAKMA